MAQQKKRTIKAAQNKNRDLIASRHYLTLVTRACSLCLLRGEDLGIKAPPSSGWEKARLRRRRRSS